MEFSGEDDQTNSAGAPPTGRDLQQQQEWWNLMPLPDDQMRSICSTFPSDADAADERSLSRRGAFGRQCA